MMKDVIIETDIGHDPDDFFTLCYLQSAGVNIRGITIHKGEPYQIAVVRMFCKEVGLDIPIGVTSLGVVDSGGVGFHHRLLNRYGYPLQAEADDEGAEVILDVMGRYPESELLIIGAPKNVSGYISRQKHNPYVHVFNQVTFQGGFIGYDVHGLPCKRLDKFEGKKTCPSFNPNGDIKGTEEIIKSNLVKKLRFVSKNVCHTIVYDKSIHEMVKMVPVKNRADELFIEGMDLYLSKHGEKKFHDPCAAVCMLHPEIAQWYKGRMYYESGGWGTMPYDPTNSETIMSIDEDKLWEHLIKRT